MAADEATVGVSRTPVHLWIIGVLALLWSLMGAFDYLATKLQLESYMGQFTPDQLDYFYSIPAWMTVFWAFGVWGGLAGSIGLLLRKKWAFWAYAVSLFGLFVSTIYGYVLTDGADVMGTTGMIMNMVVWIFAILLLIYARAMARRGVLR